MYIPICIFNSIDSTNTHAKEIIKQYPDINNFAIYAYTQTHGRGRMGNEWLSNNGNIHFTLVLKHTNTNSSNYLNILSLATAVAIKNTIQKYTNKAVKIKWPNDIIINNAKISGILIEQEANNNNNYLIIGVGINIFYKPILEKYKTICLDEIKCTKLDSLEIVNELLKNTINIYSKINDNSNDIIISYINNLYKLNQEITVNYKGNTIKGTLLGINQNGYLIINSNKQTLEIATGEVFL